MTRRGLIGALRDIPTGARVSKPDAIPFDFAYQRKGTVIRETFEGQQLSGVRFDGGRVVVEYPDDIEFVILEGEDA
jgi:hypothetical protein